MHNILIMQEIIEIIVAKNSSIIRQKTMDIINKEVLTIRIIPLLLLLIT